MCKHGLISFFVLQGLRGSLHSTRNPSKKRPEGLEDRSRPFESTLAERASSCAKGHRGSSSAHLIVLDLGPGLVLEVPVVVGVQQVQQVQQVQEGRLDLVLGLVLEVPEGVEVHEVQEV